MGGLSLFVSRESLHHKFQFPRIHRETQRQRNTCQRAAITIIASTTIFGIDLGSGPVSAPLRGQVLRL